MRASARLSVRPLSALDEDVYRRVLPEKSRLLDVSQWIDWGCFEKKLKRYYAANDEGQPEYPPIILLKLEFLGHLNQMSRRQLIERASYDLHWKYFLGLPIAACLPSHSTLSVFRSRIGPEGFQEIFDALVSMARDYGLVSDRLRLKDATHIYADIAVPTALGLFAQLRDRMLAAVRAVDASAADSFDVDLHLLRERTETAEPSIRLQGRVALVQDILQWIIEQKAPAQEAPAVRHKAWQRLQQVRHLAEKILFDQSHPGAGDKTISVVDADARRGKHGDFYDGYLLDVMMDPESELITAIDVLPANADEAKDAIALIEHEEQTQGNDVAQLSIDGIGFNGEVLRQLQDAQGLNVDVFTPPRDFNASEGFASDQFELIDGGERVRCPAGEVSGIGGHKADKPNTTFYVFSHRTCAGCALLSDCHRAFNPNGRQGRRVSKNEYEAEYASARAQAETPAYAEVRRRHPAIERKLNEIVRHHRGRRAMYRGRLRVKIQQLLTCFTVNIKRMAKLLGERCAPTLATVVN